MLSPEGQTAKSAVGNLITASAVARRAVAAMTTICDELGTNAANPTGGEIRKDRLPFSLPVAGGFRKASNAGIPWMRLGTSSAFDRRYDASPLGLLSNPHDCG